MRVYTVVMGMVFGTLASLAMAQQEAREYPVKDVREFISGGSSQVEIFQSDRDYLRVEAEREVMQRVTVDQTGSTLSLWVKSGKTGFFDWFVHGKESVKVTLHVKALDTLELSGGAQATVGPLKGEKLEVEAGGGVTIHFAELQVNRVEMEAAGATKVTIGAIQGVHHAYDISGASQVTIEQDSRAEWLQVDASGASQFHGAPLIANKARLHASGASQVTATVTEQLDADASGASQVNYKGRPEAKVSSSGAGKINAL